MKTGKINNRDKIKPYYKYPMRLFLSLLFIQGFAAPDYKRKEKKTRKRKKNNLIKSFSLCTGC